MNKVIFSVLLLLLFASCGKDVAPPAPETTKHTIQVTPEDIKLVASLKITPLTHDVKTQVIKVNTIDKQLSLAFTENVQLLIDAERFENSWYIMFKEDFSATTFADFDYKTKLAWDTVSTNWRPYNLRQIKHTVTDTLIAGARVINVKFQRVFTFYKDYETTGQATDKMNALVGRSEIIKFLTRYEPDADTTRYHTITVNAIYSR
ncbi:MAG: hypothetical protein EOP47_22460 [Sphingobacteriaceae bacterium]|nr:MAG: hypothetical protein EOP47_22460 [Sphingobacteriaceae bacterium]